MKLNELKQGNKAKITKVSDHRFREFGLFEGATIEVLRSGSPAIIRLENALVAIRGDIEVDYAGEA